VRCLSSRGILLGILQIAMAGMFWPACCEQETGPMELRISVTSFAPFRATWTIASSRLVAWRWGIPDQEVPACGWDEGPPCEVVGRMEGVISMHNMYLLFLCGGRRMHRDGDLRCINFSRIMGGFAALSSLVPVETRRYNRCIEMSHCAR
jgi:hypothetical protein